jgi:hypothetical protein
LADPPSDLAAQMAELVARGVLHPFDPAYGVALAAIDFGYEGLTHAQRRLYDRVVAPAISGLTTELGVAEFDRRGGAWKPIREAPRGTESIQLGVKVDGAISALSFPCRWSSIAWVDALSGKALHVRPTHWREWPGALSNT